MSTSPSSERSSSSKKSSSHKRKSKKSAKSKSSSHASSSTSKQLSSSDPSPSHYSPPPTQARNLAVRSGYDTELVNTHLVWGQDDEEIMIQAGAPLVPSILLDSAGVTQGPPPEAFPGPSSADKI